MSKDLQTSVKLNTKDAESKLRSLAKRIQEVQNAVTKTNTAVTKSNTQTAKITAAVNTWKRAQNQVTSAANQTAASYSKSNGLLDGMVHKMKALAATYLGIMGARAAINTSDTITSAENKLNIINNGDTQATQAQMDKMYAAALASRTGYTDMMANVSKSMTLAPDSFGGNMDNAIAFQKIMGQSYALGGASAAEQSSSMYQLIQALGSGKLAGDELRSVTEGAPKAAKLIEAYAQKVYGTTEALKDMGAQGKITSDIVVAAVLNAGDEIEQQFKTTKMTFGQLMTNFKTEATKAFEPVLQKLNDILRSEQGQKAIAGITRALWGLANVLEAVMSVAVGVFNFFVDNWGWIQYVLIAGISMIIVYLAYMAAQAIRTAVIMAASFIMANIHVIAVILTIGALVAALVMLAKTAGSGIEFIVGALVILGMAIVIIGIITGNVALIVIAAILVLAALFIAFADVIIGGAYGIASVFMAVCKNIGIFFSNLWYGAQAGFWGMIATFLLGIRELEPAFNALAKLLGFDGVTLSGVTTTAVTRAAEATSKIIGYESVGNAWDEGYAKGSAVGRSLQNKVDEFGNSTKNKITGALSTDKLNKLKSSENAGLETTVGGIGADTSEIADNTKLSADDLKYLRQIAEMEWKKEFTTANITVDMSNYNTIGGDSDLDGIVTKLSDKLYEELDIVANGVYVGG